MVNPGILNSYLTDEAFRQKVTEQVIRGRTRLPEQLAKAVGDVLSQISIKGFRSAQQAPIAKQTTALSALTKEDDGLLGIVLLSWVELNSELRKGVLEFLQRSEDQPPGPIEKRIVWSIGKAPAFAAGREPAVSVNKAALMLAWVAAIEKSSEDDGEDDDTESIAGVNDEELLGEDSSADIATAALRALPPDDPFWDDIDGFVSRMRELAAEKLQGRHSVRAHEALNAALERLSTAGAEILAFHEGSDLLEWRAEHFAEESWPHVTDGCATLSTQLAEHAAVRLESATTRKAEKERRTRLEGLEESISLQIDTLRQFLLEESPEDAPEEPPNEPMELPPQPGSGRSDDGEGSTPNVAPRAVPAGAGPKVLDDPSPAVAPPIEALSDVGVVTAPAIAEVVAVPASTTLAAAPSHGANLQTMAGAAVLDEPRTDTKAAQVWEAVGRADLAGAYWIARSLEAAGGDAEVPSWLLAAVQTSYWVDSESDPLLFELMDIASSHPFPSDPNHALLCVAAALPLCIVAPSSGFRTWLHVPEGHSYLKPVVKAVSDFAERGYAFQPALADSLDAKTDALREITSASKEAREWVQTKLRAHTTHFSRARDVWHRLSDRILSPILRFAADDDRKAVHVAAERVASLERREQIADLVHETNEQLGGRRVSDIVGEARNQLFMWTEQAVSIVARWTRAVVRLQAIERNGDWLQQQVNTLRSQLKVSLAAVEQHGVLGQRRDDDPARHVGAAVATACGRLATMLRLDVAVTNATVVHCPEPPRSGGLEAALAARLLLEPSAKLTDNGIPEPDYLPLLASDINRREPMGIEGVINGWLEQSDFRFLDRLLACVPEEVARVRIRRSIHSHQDAASQHLTKRIDEVSKGIERAAFEGLITEGDRAVWLAPLQEASVDALNVGHQFRLVESIEVELERARADRIRRQLEEWGGLEKTLENSESYRDVAPRLRDLVRQAIAEHDIRLFDEYLATVRQAFETGGRLPESWFAAASLGTLDRYLRAAPAFVESVGTGSVRAGLATGNVPAPLRDWLTDEAAAQFPRTWTDWQALATTTHTLRREALQGRLGAILSFLNFTLPASGASLSPQPKSGGTWVHFRAQLDEVGQALVPEFGTEARGTYEILCIWEQVGVDPIAKALREAELAGHNLLIVHFGRLTLPQRQTVAGQARQANVDALVLDETMLVFLAGVEREDRLPAFMACTLPFTHVNPYRPDVRGALPKEVFFGRGPMLEQLQRLSETCLVYGGRRLGKSALLEEARRRFHDPEREHVACLLNIDLVGDERAGHAVDALWSELRDALKHEKVFGSKITTSNPAEIQRHVRDWLKESARRQLLIMFDEADDFLDADAGHSFRNVIGLRSLMNDSGGRLKVVLAGLQNVQRFQGIPNQPLSHFGSPLLVGPLEPQAAHELVAKPLMALGFRFDSPDTVLRVLSYTNYHPGLIQLFCSQLVKRLHSRPRGLPPYDIPRGEVEAVYAQIKPELVARLNWNLRLDPRFQAIAGTMVLRLGRDGVVSGSIAAADLLEEAKGYWYAAFGTMTLDAFNDLLDQLCGFNVLVRGADGTYRFRSPNLPSLLTEADVRAQLRQLAAEGVPNTFAADEYHPAIDTRGRHYSVFTHGEERRLGALRPGVALVFASGANGLENIERSIGRLARPSTTLSEVPGAIEPADLLQWVRERAGFKDGGNVVVAWQRLGLWRTGLENGIHELARAITTSPASLRVVLVGGPPEAHAFITVPLNRRGALLNAIDTVVACTEWTLAAVDQRLRQGQLDSGSRSAKDVLAASGGWHQLIETICSAKSGDEGLEAMLATFQTGFDKPVGQAVFRAALGLDAYPEAAKLFSVLARGEYSPLSEEYIPIWIADQGEQVTDAAVADIVEFLKTLRLLRPDHEGNLVLEQIARRAVLHQ